MRIAVISDIHGNATAFREVLKDIELNEIDRIFCLGDNIGYGPEPEMVVNLLQDRQIPSVIGNHELAVNKPNFLRWFNPIARKSLEKTVSFLTPPALGYIAGLPEMIVHDRCRFVHGFPPDSPTLYLFEMTTDDIREAMEKMTEWICFIGHTHELLMLEWDGERVERKTLGRHNVTLDPDLKYIINVGSVGQPRDGNKDAKYVVWDNAKNELEVKFVPYDVTDTVNKIYKAGLPEQHAWRLM